MPTREQLTGALEVVVNLVRSIAVKRALSSVDADPPLNFWRVINGNLLDMAVLDWCKLFGSDDEEHQQVHWKNVFEDEQAFRSGLFAQLGLDRSAFTNFWNEMKTYRDQYVAHLDFRRRNLTNFPDLTLALASSAYYYQQLITALRTQGEVRYPDDLMTYYDAFLAQAAEIAGMATTSTRGFPKRVG